MKEIIYVSFYLTCGICLGVIAILGYNYFYPNTIINDCNTQVKVMGLWLPKLEYVKDYSGRFICINIDETQTLEQLDNVCKHEIGHEIFAEYCADNFTKCEEIAK